MVVKTISSIHHHALKIGHSFLVGYYGDIRQNIYDRGVGAKIFQLHKGLTPIQKEFNRRSSPKIIGVANLIRNDGLRSYVIDGRLVSIILSIALS